MIRADFDSRTLHKLVVSVMVRTELSWQFKSMDRLGDTKDLMSLPRTYINNHNHIMDLNVGNLKIDGVKACSYIGTCKRHTDCDYKLRFTRRSKANALKKFNLADRPGDEFFVVEDKGSCANRGLNFATIKKFNCHRFACGRSIPDSLLREMADFGHST